MPNKRGAKKWGKPRINLNKTTTVKKTSGCSSCNKRKKKLSK